MAVMEMRAGQPKHPQYSVDAVRLSSYSKWPIASSQNPAMLCDAGFFYTGTYTCMYGLKYHIRIMGLEEACFKQMLLC